MDEDNDMISVISFSRALVNKRVCIGEVDQPALKVMIKLIKDLVCVGVWVLVGWRV
jgi:hypothetical protein